MVTIYTVTYNEELIIEFFINHYKKKFSDCEIVIFDNYSTDNTVKIAESLGCVVKFYDTDNKFSDRSIINIKNNCWKESKTDWVVVCDCDELIQIDKNQLIEEEKNGITIFKFNGYNLMNIEDHDVDLENISYGWPDESYDKILLFNKNKIEEINYNYGCHNSKPIGILKFSESYKMFHYRFLSKNYTIKRNKKFLERLSYDNINLGLGYHYGIEEEYINLLYDNNKKHLLKLK